MGATIKVAGEQQLPRELAIDSIDQAGHVFLARHLGIQHLHFGELCPGIDRGGRVKFRPAELREVRVCSTQLNA